MCFSSRFSRARQTLRPGAFGFSFAKRFPYRYPVAARTRTSDPAAAAGPPGALQLWSLRFGPPLLPPLPLHVAHVLSVEGISVMTMLTAESLEPEQNCSAHQEPPTPLACDGDGAATRSGTRGRLGGGVPARTYRKASTHLDPARAPDNVHDVVERRWSRNEDVCITRIVSCGTRGV